MSDSTIFAPISIDRMWLTKVDFAIDPEPADKMVVKVDLDLGKGHVNRSDDGVVHETVELAVRALLVNEDDEDDVRMSASASMITEVSTDFPGLSDEDAERYLTRNAVSMSYSHARSCIMAVSAMSPMGGFTLPPILPDEILRGHDVNIEKGQSKKG